jgi:iron complex outermembrane recepter protein
MARARLALLSLTASAASFAGASPTEPVNSVAPSEVVVTATRLEASPFNIPAAISRVAAEQLRENALGVNLADDVATVPGLLARNRNNYAQDQQISIRGIGANSAFGIRGVRVYQDGIPATGPDGQGQVSQFNLDSAERVEILRGPFSALYGNSSGGVIQLFTANGSTPGELRSALAYGSFDTFRAGLSASGEAGPFAYNAAFTHFTVDGYRDHSSARNESFNGKFDYQINDSNRVSLITNIVSRPDAEDPLGITPAQFAADPDQTAAVALQFNTRKSLDQQQAGLIYDLDINDRQSVRLLGYYGQRDVEQFLSIPAAVQGAPTHSGGVIDLDRKFGGGDARWSWRGSLAERPFSWVVGVSYDRQNELRRGYNNFVGTTLGVKGALRRDENNISYDIDQYAQGTWDFAPAWSATVGVRHSEVNFDSEDHFITAANGDDSGSVKYEATSPVAGLLFKARPWLHLYASYGKGFQTPLGSELAYRADGSTGLNLALRPARSNNGELGAKVQVNQDLTGEVTLFQARTRNEIIIDTNVGGRSTYRNAGRTERSGAEVAFAYRFAESWRAQLAYTYVDATYSEVNSGNRLPGVPKNSLYTNLRWGSDLGWHVGANGQHVSAVAVNDTNSVFTPSYTIFGADVGYGMDLRAFRMSTFVRANNLFNKRYVGSVIVNDGNSRFFEPGPGFNVLAGVSLTMK